MQTDARRTTTYKVLAATLTAIVFMQPLGTAFASAASETLASEILAATGVRGGLVVHVGCDDGRLTAALHANSSLIVHGLDSDQDEVTAAREYVRSQGLSGPVAIDHFDGRRLPYVDGLVNLLVLSTHRDLPVDEIARVLAPRGIVVAAGDSRRFEQSPELRVADVQLSGWSAYARCVPAEIDEWTHFLHGPDGHVMSNDSKVAPPYHIQWIGSPKHSKSHVHLTTVNVMVSSGGRLFAIADESPTALPESLPSRWALIARDAFNGIELWRRPLDSWQPYYVKDRNSYPADLHRRLVAADQRVFATLSIHGPVSALDAATGETVKTYAGTDQAEDILFENGILYLSINTGPREQIDRLQMAYRHVEPPEKRVMAIHAESGRVLWQKEDEDTNGLMPMTLAVKNSQLYFQNEADVICVDKATGEVVWRSPRPSDYFRPGWSAPTLVALDDVVISADRQSGPGQKIGKDKYAAGGFSTGNLVALSARTGERLWSAPCAEGCRAPTDVFAMGNRVWFGKTLERKTHEYRETHDLLTGEILRETPLEERFPNWHHHRCYRDKATCQYILGSRTGVEFIDLDSGKVSLHNWIRGNCKFGVLPCNGLLYMPPEQCGCYIESKLTGFHALAPKRPIALARTDAHPLEAGATGAMELSDAAPDPEDWPTFRGNNSRSGCVRTQIPTDLEQAWRTELGGRLTQAVVADGRLFVASIDEHTLYMLDAETGAVQHSFVAGGRIDSPPTIARGLAVFGSHDGWIYALNCADGRLAWRYRAAPDSSNLVDRGHVESVWPVHGSLLVQDDMVYFAAGRSSYVDGGIRMGKLDLATGEPIQRKTFYSRDPKSGDAINLYEPFQAGRLTSMEMPGVLPDVISSEGQRLWMRAVAFDTELNIQQEPSTHLFSSMGFLDDSWWELTYWIYGEHMFSGRSGITHAMRLYPTARLMVYDDDKIYGYQEGYEKLVEPGLVAAPKVTKKSAGNGGGRSKPDMYDWHKDVPLHAFGLVLADDTLFMAGPPRIDTEKTRELLVRLQVDRYDPPPILKEASETFEGERGGLIYAARARDGQPVVKASLDSIPVFDGLIAAQGCLFIALKDGSVVCLR